MCIFMYYELCVHSYSYLLKKILIFESNFFIDSFLERKDCLSNFNNRKIRWQINRNLILNKYLTIFSVSNFENRE